MEKDSSLARGDIYTRVTNQIVEAIEAGIGDYHMPWHQGNAGFPRNVVTKNPYRGVNILALWSTSRLRGYTSPYWATYLQWSAQGAQVRKGEKASAVVFFKRDTDERENESEGHIATRQRLVVRASSVFNADQVDGWRKAEVLPEDITEHHDSIDVFVSGLGADIRYGGDVAGYDKSSDRIHMPERRRFVGTETSTATEAFYSVLLHEHVHWSGHPKRLDRDLSGRFGDFAYAMEELVAELGAAFLCAELGISLDPRRDHAAYVHVWLVVLRQHKTAIVSASGAAMRACGYLGELASEKQRAA